MEIRKPRTFMYGVFYLVSAGNYLMIESFPDLTGVLSESKL